MRVMTVKVILCLICVWCAGFNVMANPTNGYSLMLAKPSTNAAYLEGLFSQPRSAEQKRVLNASRMGCEHASSRKPLVRDHFQMTDLDKKEIADAINSSLRKEPDPSSPFFVEGQAQEITAFSDGCIDVGIAVFSGRFARVYTITIRPKNGKWQHYTSLGGIGD